MQRYYGTLVLAVLVLFLWGGAAFAACPPFPGTGASPAAIQAWGDACVATMPASGGSGGNACKNRDTAGNPILQLWAFVPGYIYEKKIRQGVSLECPTDEAITTEDETDLYWTDGKIRVKYAPCNGVPVADSTQVNGYRCDGGSAAATEMELTAGGCEEAYGIPFCAKREGNLLCAYVPHGAQSILIGCHGYNTNISSISTNLACFIPTVCNTKTMDYSQNPFGFSLSGTIVLCFEGAIEQLFFGSSGGILDPSVTLDYNSGGDITYTVGDVTMSNDDFYAGASCTGDTMFTRVQDALKAAVSAALALYVILWGLKITVSGEVTSRGEFIKNVVVFSLVVYFSIGDGWREYFPLLRQLIVGLSIQMLRGNLAGVTGSNPCIFSVDSYPHGLESMALWDMLDCKIINYMFSGEDLPKIILLGVVAIFNYPTGIVLFIFIIMFCIFMTVMFLFTLQIYIIAMIVIAMLMFISPLIIPMSLFTFTKGYFSSWLDQVIASSLYPIILIGFISVMLTTFDKFYYGDGSGTLTVYATPGSGHLFTSCDEKSFGCQLDKARIHGFLDIDGFNIDTALLQLLRVCLFAFLFYKFTLMLPQFLAELTGSAKVNMGGMAISPHKMIASIEKQVKG